MGDTLRFMQTMVGCILFLALLSCAHKAPPLEKDRLSPRLQKILAINNRQLLFTFSEELDTLNLKSENITIAGNNDTLKIFTLYPSLSPAEIIVCTNQQDNIIYEVTGYVFDKAENKGNLKKIFLGTTKPDTISPWLVSYSKGINLKEFDFIFSEAMDTSSLKFYIIPKKIFFVNWRNNRAAAIVPKAPPDSIGYDTTYYLYLKDIKDLSNNAISPFITYITRDTIYKPSILKGKAMIDDTMVSKGLAVLKRKIPLAITKVDKGEFLFEVRDSSDYFVEVVADKYYGSATISIVRENIVVLKPQEIDIDSIVN